MNKIPYKLAIINQLTDSQLDESVMMCIRSYVDSPSVVAMTGGNKSLVGPLFRAMIRACQLAGRVYIATVIDTGSIAGLALWFPPGKVLWQNDAQRNLGFNQFLESLSPKTREWWINTYGSALAPFITTALSPHTVESSWYLNCICVDPKYQRQGIATNLIKMVEQNAMTTSILALCTDTDVNVAVYKALHFQYKGEAPLPTPENECINVHCFTKPGARV
jgi:ribosomal protein S18 acetylase RimI-like enzyme